MTDSKRLITTAVALGSSIKLLIDYGVYLSDYAASRFAYPIIAPALPDSIKRHQQRTAERKFVQARAKNQNPGVR